MILEMIVGGIVIVEIIRAVRSPRFSAELKDPLIRAICEKRRVLERDRAEWARSYSLSNGDGAVQKVAEIDKQLLELADEEAALAMGKDEDE